MKFAEHLAAHITPEWRKQYIQYEEMKAMLYEVIQEAPAPEVVEPEVLTRYYAKFDEKFFTFCDKELTKINTFYSEKLAEATRKYSALNSELTDTLDYNPKNERSLFGFGAKKAFLGSSDPKAAGSSAQAPAGKGNTDGGHASGPMANAASTTAATTARDRPSTRKLQDLKFAFSEYYLSLVLLQNYQNLNFTGFRKILKKHDKNLNTDTGARWRSEHVDSAMFYTNKAIDKLIQDTEGTFITELESGDRQKAMKRLRVPPLGDKQSPWTTFKVGLFVGAFVVLIVTVVLSATYLESNRTAMTVPFGANTTTMAGEAVKVNDWRIVARLYRGPFLLIVFMFLMGINVYGWRSSGVNHVLIFELDPRNHLSEQHLMEVAAIFGVVWSLSVLSFLYSDYLSIPAYASPLALVSIMLLFMVNPTRTFRHEARFWLLRVLGRIVCAPFFYVGFADFWVADQLNSLVPALTDFHYLVCFYSHPDSTVDGKWEVATDINLCVKNNWVRPMVSCLPAWFRFAQCLRRYRDTREAFPHLLNAGKYSTTFFVVLFSTLNAVVSLSGDAEPEDKVHNPFFYVWIVCSVGSSLYAYTWDIKMDWGLLDRSTATSAENRVLREDIVYASKGYYYFAILEDFVLRFGWAVSLSLTEMGFSNGDLITTILSSLEVFRRFVWNFFRLENEHLNNCGQFRAVRDISVAPITAADHADIIMMMDEEDGVINVRAKKKPVSTLGLLSGQQNLAIVAPFALTSTSASSAILKSRAKKARLQEVSVEGDQDVRPLLDESSSKVSRA